MLVIVVIVFVDMLSICLPAAASQFWPIFGQVFHGHLLYFFFCFLSSFHFLDRSHQLYSQMEADTYVQASALPNSKRFVVEDSSKCQV